MTDPQAGVFAQEPNRFRDRPLMRRYRVTEDGAVVAIDILHCPPPQLVEPLAEVLGEKLRRKNVLTQFGHDVFAGRDTPEVLFFESVARRVRAVALNAQIN